MKTTSTILAVTATILASVIIGAYLYPLMPDTLPSHWNIRGEVDGYMSKFWGLFLMPIVSVVLFLLFISIPKLDPKKENIEKFRSYFNGFIFLIALFLFYVYLLTIYYSLGYRFDMIRFLVPAFAILIFYAGILIEHAKRNWFIGIRTPWTLESEDVWNKTHALGGKLFKAVALIALLGISLPDYAIYLLLIPLILIVVFLITFSYHEYKGEKSLTK